MALFPSIMSLFGGKASPEHQISPQSPQNLTIQPPAQTQTNPAQVVIQQANAAGNPTIPSSATPTSNGSVAAIPAVGQGDASPLANFKDLWKTDPNPTGTAQPTLVPNFNLDPKGIMEQSSKIDFTKHINPELLQKAVSGDGASLLAVINQAAQFGFANATMASGELVKNSLGSAQGILKDTILPAAMRQHQVSQAIDATNPIFQNPAVSPMLDMVKNQFAAKYPTAPADEIATLANKYLQDTANLIVTGGGGTVVPKGQGQSGNQTGFSSQPETDWGKFFNT